MTLPCGFYEGGRYISGYYKIGNPYLIDGVPYYPHEDFNYVEVGTASWYGEEFHGSKTDNNEIFDKNKFTAAHRTLPMPSLVRVTNLENGRAVTVRINDRGPFARDRIIDLSQAAAEAIGMKEAGFARVRVEILAEESQNLKRLAQRCQPTDIYGPNITHGEAPPLQIREEKIIVGPIMIGGMPDRLPEPEPEPVHVPEPEPEPEVLVEEMIAPEPEPAPAPVPVPVPAGSRSFYVQVAAFSTFEKAEALKNSVVRHGDVKIFRATQNGRPIFKVRLGAYATESEAIAAQASLNRAGITGSRVLRNDDGALTWR
jgi:rare lipoprotein A